MTAIIDVMLWPLDRLFDVLAERRELRIFRPATEPGVITVPLGDLTAEAREFIRGAS